MIINVFTNMIINDTHFYGDHDYDKYHNFYIYHYSLRNNCKTHILLL